MSEAQEIWETKESSIDQERADYGSNRAMDRASASCIGAEPGSPVVGSEAGKEGLREVEIVAGMLDQTPKSELISQILALKTRIRELEEVLEGISRSNSWRITAPLRAIVACSKKVLPLWRNARLRLLPGASHNIACSPSWAAKITGLSSWIRLNAERDFSPGWALLRGRLQSPQSHHHFYLYFGSVSQGEDTPSFNMNNRVWVAFEDNKPQTFLIKLPELPRGKELAIRIDPFESQGEFEFKELELKELGSLQLLGGVLAKQLKGAIRNPALFWHKGRKLVATLRSGGFAALRVKLFNDNLSSNYQEWVNKYDTISDSDRVAIREDVSQFEHQPLISVLLPVYNTPEIWLRKAIESVTSQLYSKWELCIADDCSTQQEVREILREYASKDARIKVNYRETNGHISKASNSCLELATGEYIALLDHDDELTEHALYHVVKEINRSPDAALIYSDEDKKSAGGVRYNPYFKSDWNPDLFLSQNYICHLAVYKRILVEQLGGFRAGFEGAQDWDLAWRVADSCKPGQIKHIPRVLYHWRVIEGSTAQSTSAKPYVLEAQRKTVSEHLERVGLQRASVEILHDISQLRVKFPLPEPAPLVSIIIPTKDQPKFLERCIRSIIEKSSYRNFEIIIVNNRSCEPETFALFEELKRDPRITVIDDSRPFNYSQLNNSAVRYAKGELLAFLNNDLEVITPDWLSEMVSQLCRAGIGAVGARLWYPNYHLQHAGVILGIGGVAGHNHKGIARGNVGYFNRAVLPQNLSAVTAACMVVHRKIFEDVGGFDEGRLAVAFNDVDLCLKIRKAGHLIVYTPYAELVHFESISRGYETTPEKFTRFESEIAAMKERWGPLLERDPYYNPNLTIIHEDFTFAFPPRV